MTISSISLNSDYSPSYSINSSDGLKQQRQQDFKSIANALQSGDLSTAQSAFASLLQTFPNSSSPVNNLTQNATAASATGSGNSANSVSSDLSALGQAIQSGDLTGAQNDFSKLMRDMQSIGGGHHHHHHYKTSANAPQTTTAAATGSDASTNSIATDLAALGQVLQTGDLNSAGSIFSRLIQDMQTINQANSQPYVLAGSLPANSTANSNTGFQQFLNMWTQAITRGSSINTSA